MEFKTENNYPIEQKVKKKNHNIFKNHRNKVTKKLADDQKEKLLSMAKRNLKNVPCTSSNKNIVVSKLNGTSTSCYNIFQNGEQHEQLGSISTNRAENLRLSCSDINLSKVVDPIDSSDMNVTTPITTDKHQSKSFNKNLNAKLSFDLENGIQVNGLKHPNLIQFVRSEDNNFVRCFYCHIMIRFDIGVLNKHLKICKQFVQTTLNYIKKFNCFVCNITVNSLKDWETHAVVTNHLDKCMDTNNYVSYDCGGCKTVFFGDKEQILSHCKEIHKNPSGLPSIFKFIKEVFHEFIVGNQKCWTFCSPCKKYSSSPLVCSLLNHKNKKIKHFKCNTCLVDFKCSRDVYNKHLLSCEHFMLEHLKTKIKCTPESQEMSSSLKLPQIFLNAFTFNREKTICNACKVQIVPDEKAITVHLTSCVFKSDLVGKNALPIQKYFCAVCNEIILDFSQWKYHLILLNHLTKCHDFNDLVSYTCEICSLHCYGSARHVAIHQDVHPNDSEKKFSSFIALNYQRINNDLRSKDFYYCEDCDTYAEVNSSDHWNKSHKNKLKRMVCQPCRVEFFCIEGNNLFDRHTLSNEHILLKYLASKNTFVESKPCALQQLNELKNVNEKSNSKDPFEILKTPLPSINKLYSNWFVEDDKNKAICKICNEPLDVNENTFLSHLLVCEQILAKSIPETKINFKCFVCCFYSSECEQWKLHLISHVKFDFYGLYSYFCKICSSLLYGKMNDIEIHLNNEHSTVFSEMPLETSLVAKQLIKRNNNSCKPPDIMCVCSPCNKIFKLLENPNHFNSDSHLSVASDIVELFYCKHCQVEMYSSIASIEIHKLTVEHILSSKHGELEIENTPKPLKLDYHLLKFITNQTLYETTQNIGFFCFICDYLCLELGLWKMHINGKKHVNTSKCFSCIDHRCKICKTLIFGQRQHIFEHYNNRFHSMLRQLKKLRLTNVEVKNNSLQSNSNTNLLSKMKTTSESNKKTENENNTVGNPLNSNEISSFQKVLLKLSTQSNDLHNCNMLGDSTSIIDEIDAVTKQVGELNLGSSFKQSNFIDTSNENFVGTCPLTTTTDEIDSESSTPNFSYFYKLRIKVLKESLDKKKELVPQINYYCVPCDYITGTKNNWDKHNLTEHLNENKVRHQIFCDVCSLFEVGPSCSLEKHLKTIEHKNMKEVFKSCQPNIMDMDDETKEKNESDLVTGKAKTSVTDKQEINKKNKDEKDLKTNKTVFEIKGMKPSYTNNAYTELKKIIASYGFFGLFPKNNYVLIVFRKSSCNPLFWKDKEKLEKEHGFTISVAPPEEEKLPELHRITKYEFGNKVKLTQNINFQVYTINQEISYSDIEKRLILLINSIHYYAGHHFSDGKIFAFGSRMSGLALKDSDVDLYFDIANTFFGSLSNDLCAQEDLVRYFGKVFRSKNNEFKQIQMITSARVPIVKFFHQPSGLNCDLSFKSGLSTHNTKLIRLYLTLDERIHWVVCAIVKRWALQNSIKNQSMFTSYALAWLVLFYLMTIKVVPPLKLLRNNAVYSSNSSALEKSDEMFIEDWDCTFCTPEKAKQIWKVPDVHRWDLLFSFFKFYSDSNRLKQYVLCPAIGEALPKEYFYEIPLKHPEELGFDKKRVGNPLQWCNRLKNNFKGEGLAMQDPFDLFHNITKTITPRKLREFSHLCSSTLEVMTPRTQPYYG